MGLGLHGDKVFVPTSDIHLLALNAKTGELIWDHEIRTEATGSFLGGYQLRTAPLAVGDNVIQFGVAAKTTVETRISLPQRCGTWPTVVVSPFHEGQGKIE